MLDNSAQPDYPISIIFYEFVMKYCILLAISIIFPIISLSQTPTIYLPPHAAGKWLNTPVILYAVPSTDSMKLGDVKFELSALLLENSTTIWNNGAGKNLINPSGFAPYNTSPNEILFDNTTGSNNLFGIGNKECPNYMDAVLDFVRNKRKNLSAMLGATVYYFDTLNYRSLKRVHVEINQDFWRLGILTQFGGQIPETQLGDSSYDIRLTAAHEIGHFLGMKGDTLIIPKGSIMNHNDVQDSCIFAWQQVLSETDKILIQSIYPTVPVGRRGCTPRVVTTLSNGSPAYISMLGEDSFGAIFTHILEPWLLYNHPVTRAWRSLIQNSGDEIITAVNQDNTLQAALNTCIAHNLDFFDSQVGANPLPLSRDNIQSIVEFLRTLSAQKKLSPQTLTSILNLMEVVQDSEGKTLWRILLDMLHGDVRPLLDAQNKQPRSGDAFEKPFVFPNPALADRTALVYFLPQRSFVTLRLFNSTGQYIETVAQGMYNAGELQLEINMKHLSSGAYFYRLQVNDANLSGKIILTR